MMTLQFNISSVAVNEYEEDCKNSMVMHLGNFFVRIQIKFM